MDRYKGDVYMQLLQKTPSTLNEHFFDLPRELQLVITMIYFENHTSKAWELKINGLKVVIEVKAQEMCTEQESEMS